MSGIPPITADLRGRMRYEADVTATEDRSVARFAYPDFADACDAIDAVHAALESENAGLRELCADLYEFATGTCMVACVDGERMRRFMDEGLELAHRMDALGVKWIKEDR